jgi:hypothetical protein
MKRQDAEGFYKELLKESDRAAVILAAARLEAQLHGLLNAFCVEDEQITGGVLNRFNFDKKIGLAYCLGLIPKELDSGTFMPPFPVREDRRSRSGRG